MHTSPRRARYRMQPLVLLIVALALPACSGVRHVSGPEFVRIKGRMRASSLDLLDTYTARANGKIFYYEETMRLFRPGTHKRLYWAWMKELPPEIIADIRAGRNGWDGCKTTSEKLEEDEAARQKRNVGGVRFGRPGSILTRNAIDDLLNNRPCAEALSRPSTVHPAPMSQRPVGMPQ